MKIIMIMHPLFEYILGAIVAAYRDFSSRVQILIESGFSKPERVRAIIKRNVGKIQKRRL